MRIKKQKLPDLDSLWDYAHPDQTERKFRKIVPYFSKAYQVLSQDTWLPEQGPSLLARLSRLGEGQE